MMDAYLQIVVGSFLLSLVHASIPSHWLPLIAISKAEKWNEPETLRVTAITGISHTLSTIIIGFIVGIIGYKLSESYHYITHIIAPIVLVLLGLIYFYLEYKHNKAANEHHHHHHSHIDVDEIIQQRKTKKSIVLTLCITMFFSPCLEVEVYYFTASRLGWAGIGIVSIIYLLVTVLGMLILVYVASRGVQKLKWHFLEHHEKLVSGIVLILVGAMAFFIEL